MAGHIGRLKRDTNKCVGLIAANPTKPVQSKSLSKVQESTTVEREPHSTSIRTGGTHCFRQCTRPIHSAHTCRTSATNLPNCRCTSGVRRQSAAKRGHSPESPPSAACCLPGTMRHRLKMPQLQISRQGWQLRCLSPLSPFVTVESGHHSRNGRDATALPRHKQPPWKGGFLFQTFV